MTWRHNWILSLDICPHTQVAKRVSTNLSLGYNQLYWVIQIAILENIHRVIIFKWTLTSIYIHRVIILQNVCMESYDASKNRLQDLKHFPTFKTVTIILQKQFLQCLIDWEESSINRRLFSINRTGIEHQSSQAEASDQFS